jgi:hypothetical protein
LLSTHFLPLLQTPLYIHKSKFDHHFAHSGREYLRTDFMALLDIFIYILILNTTSHGPREVDEWHPHAWPLCQSEALFNSHFSIRCFMSTSKGQLPEDVTCAFSQTQSVGAVKNARLLCRAACLTEGRAVVIDRGYREVEPQQAAGGARQACRWG